jgi:hypothetical protein
VAPMKDPETALAAWRNAERPVSPEMSPDDGTRFTVTRVSSESWAERRQHLFNQMVAANISEDRANSLLLAWEAHAIDYGPRRDDERYWPTAIVWLVLKARSGFAISRGR